MNRIWACASQIQWHNELARWMSSLSIWVSSYTWKGQIFSYFAFFWIKQKQWRLTRQLWPFCCIFHSTSGLEIHQFDQNSKCKAQGCSFLVPDQVSCWSREILSLILHRPATSTSTAISFRLCCGDVWTKTDNSYLPLYVLGPERRQRHTSHKSALVVKYLTIVLKKNELIKCFCFFQDVKVCKTDKL